jgi:hypothetical protein
MSFIKLKVNVIDSMTILKTSDFYNAIINGDNEFKDMSI